jgi:hypothetical protein
LLDTFIGDHDRHTSRPQPVVLPPAWSSGAGWHAERAPAPYRARRYFLHAWLHPPGEPGHGEDVARDLGQDLWILALVRWLAIFLSRWL